MSNQNKTQEWDDDPVVKKLVRGKFQKVVLKGWTGVTKTGAALDRCRRLHRRRTRPR